jgi:hypothetical protein
MSVRDVLQLNKFPYTYDIIKPKPKTELKAFIELIDIPIPRETIEFNVYLHGKGLVLDKVNHFAGSAVWFGINRDEFDCCRCNVGLTNIKIDIEEYVKESNITKANIGDYVMVLEGEGKLIKTSDKYQVYNMADLIKGGRYEVILI